mmetsp:Transcript_20282/g.32462  ORF Transcript_20282/g.32462 Transcript_20282/m.32462 type:complete len:603 (-) Transcript_20282:150-1958(-)
MRGVDLALVEQGLRRRLVVRHNGCLVRQHVALQRETQNRVLLVDEEDAVGARQVAQHVAHAVQVRQRGHVPANVVVQAVVGRGRRVHEHVVAEGARHHALVHVVLQRERSLDAVLRHVHLVRHVLVDNLAVVAQHVIVLGAHQRHQGALRRRRPIHVQRRALNATNAHAALPAVEVDGSVVVAVAAAARLCRQQMPAKNVRNRVRRSNGAMLAERAMNDELLVGDARRVHIALRRRPRKLVRLAKRLMLEAQRGVNRVLAIAAHRDQLPVLVVAHVRRVKLSRAEVVHAQLRHHRAIRHRRKLGGAATQQLEQLNVVVARPHHFAAAVHRRHRLFLPERQHDGALVKADRHAVASRQARHAPHALHAIVQRRLQAVRARVPQLDRAILGATDNHRQRRMKGHRRNVRAVPFQGRDARLGLVVPHLDQVVVGAAHQKWPFTAAIVRDGVHAAFVPFQREMRHRRVEAPDFDTAIERRRRKRVVVLWIDRNLHHIVGVPFKNDGVLPVIVPIPQLDAHVVGRTENEGQTRMHRNTANVVGVRLKLLHLLARVVVVDANVHVVGAAHQPILALDKLGGTHRHLGYLKRAHNTLRVIVPNENVTAV